MLNIIIFIAFLEYEICVFSLKQKIWASGLGEMAQPIYPTASDHYQVQSMSW